MNGGPVCVMYLLATLHDSGVWGRFDHQRPTFGTLELVILGIAGLLPVIAVMWQLVVRRGEREFRSASTARLFGELCRAHQLGRSSRRLLKRLAVMRGLNTPAMLFIEPDHFDLTTLSPDLKPLAAELRQLRHRLFD
jgi:hypothetical protein